MNIVSLVLNQNMWGILLVLIDTGIQPPTRAQGQAFREPDMAGSWVCPKNGSLMHYFQTKPKHDVFTNNEDWL